MSRFSRHTARPVVSGEASGEALVLGARLSFAGGVSLETGRIIDHRHPRAGACVTGSILVMPSGRGSSTSSNVIGELLRKGLGPAAIIMLEVDQIVIMGVLLAQTLYGTVCPVLVADQADFDAIAEGALVEVHSNGEFKIGSEIA
jgi:predicted aconitase with swiveling domain